MENISLSFSFCVYAITELERLLRSFLWLLFCTGIYSEVNCDFRSFAHVGRRYHGVL